MASALDENLAGLIGPLLSHLDGNANKAMPPRMPGDGVESGDKEKLMFESAILQDLNLSPTKTKDSAPPSDDNNNVKEKQVGSLKSVVGVLKWNWMDPVSKKQYSGTRKVENMQKIRDQKLRLPIFQFKTQFVNQVSFNQVTVVVGETGSGKSTQMPQYLLESGVISGRIAVTQPRRVAAVSVAARVAEEVGCRVGEQVGYAIRFEDITSPGTIIKYMTDGLLVMECLKDPLLAAYDCIILDEAHERTLHTDVLLGIIKKAIRHRPELKIVITSATLDIKKFAEYFDAPMVKIPGKVFPVTVRHLPSHGRMGHATYRGFSQAPQRALWSRTNNPEAYINMAIEKVLQIHTENLARTGDILLFLPGKEEVETACNLLANRSPNLKALPVYAALPFESQCEIFSGAAAGTRKVVVATNIAETSITIDGILFVVDIGYFKESTYDKGIDTLKVKVISKAQANQRCGRAGRTAPGICYRMYTKEDYDSMHEVPKPCIHRIDFTTTALQLKAMGIGDICRFGFMDPPQPQRVKYALQRLKALGAVDKEERITSLGFQMSEFPLAPHLSKILLTAADMGCSDEVLTIVSMLSVKYVFIRPHHKFRRKQKEADEAKAAFNDEYGDHLTLLKVWKAWRAAGMSEAWAKENYVHQKELERANDIRNQLVALMNIHGVPILSAGTYLSNIRKALSTGEPINVARYIQRHVDDDKNQVAYRTMVNKQVVYIHPSSALYKVYPPPEYVIYHETITTTRNFMRVVSACERRWVQTLKESLY